MGKLGPIRFFEISKGTGRVLGLEPGGVVGIEVSKYNWVWERSDRGKIRDVVS